MLAYPALDIATCADVNDRSAVKKVINASCHAFLRFAFELSLTVSGECSVGIGSTIDEAGRVRVAGLETSWEGRVREGRDGAPGAVWRVFKRSLNWAEMLVD